MTSVARQSISQSTVDDGAHSLTHSQSLTISQSVSQSVSVSVGGKKGVFLFLETCKAVVFAFVRSDFWKPAKVGGWHGSWMAWMGWDGMGWIKGFGGSLWMAWHGLRAFGGCIGWHGSWIEGFGGCTRWMDGWMAWMAWMD